MEQDRLVVDNPWKAFSPLAFEFLNPSSTFREIAESILKRTLSTDALLRMGPKIDMATVLGLQQSLGTLSRLDDFAQADEEPTFYSEELVEPGSYFERHEVVVDSFRGLNAAITTLTEKHPNLTLVWRGAQNADWGMHSSLYRHLMAQNEVKAPGQRPTQPQNYPDEDQMVQAEKTILRLAREDWRFDGMPALELFARIQHVGGPTRLLDVSQNPYVAAWFAVERHDKHDHEDARLFALATRPIVDPDVAAPTSRVLLDERGSARLPFWHILDHTIARQTFDWGTGARRWFWVPPAYDPRMLAQNAGFLLDGVPMTSAKTASYFSKGTRLGNWQRSDILAASSIYAKTYNPARKGQANKPNLAPTFSFRITRDAKRDIRAVLETRFGYRSSSIYPDISGLAQALSNETLTP